MRTLIVQTFELFLDDDRYSVPTLKLVSADDTRDAVVIASRLLDESEHHRGVEICCEGRRLAGLGSLAARRVVAEPSTGSR